MDTNNQIWSINGVSLEIIEDTYYMIDIVTHLCNAIRTLNDTIDRLDNELIYLEDHIRNMETA